MPVSPSNSSGIEIAGSHHLELAAALFEQFPFKSVQRRFQHLPQDRLVRFYTQGFERDLGANRDRWVGVEANRLVALAGLNPDAHHSGIYDLRMGKIAPWTLLPDFEKSGELLDRIETRARELDIQHLSVRLDGEDFSSLHLFESRGFRLIDVSLKLCRIFPPAGAWDVPESPRVGWGIRKFVSGDAEWMIPLGGNGHGQNHFLNDPALDPEATSRLFSDWVRKCIEGLAYTIYVLEDPSGQGRGFVTYLRNPGFSKAVGRTPLILDYVILDPKLRGGGLGPWLIEESLYRERAEGFDFCELRTSQHNHRAVIGYEKLEFRLCATDFILHRVL